MNFTVENIDVFGFNKIVNFVKFNTALSTHTQAFRLRSTPGSATPISTTLNKLLKKYYYFSFDKYFFGVFAICTKHYFYGNIKIFNQQYCLTI